MTGLVSSNCSRADPVQSAQAGDSARAEGDRLDVLRGYEVLDTPPDGNFDRITRLAAELFEVPIAIVTLVDEDRIWFKSQVGIDDIVEIPRDPGLCASAILASEVYVVESARSDVRTLANPLVAGELGLQFYAAAPLSTAEATVWAPSALSTTEPRTLTDAQKSALETLAGVVMDQMELRLVTRQVVRAEREQRAAAQAVAGALQTFLLPARLPDVEGVEVVATYRPANAEVVGGDFYDVFRSREATWFLAMGDVCGKGPQAAALTAAVRYALRAASMHEQAPATILELVNETLLSGVDDHFSSQWCTLAIARLDPHPDGATLHVASGGHPLPILLRADGVAESIGGQGSLVGALAAGEWTTVTTELRSSDTVVFFTDGVTEARIGTEFFGRDGLERALQGRRHLAPSQLIESVLGEMSGLGAVRHDDVALLAARVR